MRVIANRQLRGDYGTVVAGQEFECTDQVGRYLLEQKMAREARPPRIEYDTKVIVPRETPEVSPRTPFRDVSMRDEKSPAVAAESDRVLPEPDLSESRDADPGRRRGLSRLIAKGGRIQTDSSRRVEANR